MATALVRDLDDEVYERLKARAAGNNRSLEAELREILVLASKQVDMSQARAVAEAILARAAEIARGLDALDDMGDEEEQRQTLDALRKAIDEEPLSARKRFRP